MTNVQIRESGMEELMGLTEGLSVSDKDAFVRCVLAAVCVRVGLFDGKLVCAWGIIPPTILSTTAYLWLYCTEDVAENEFLFIRHSQREIELLLKEYQSIIGHADPQNVRGVRWLKWLGAKFGEPEGKLMPFEIRRK